MKPNVSQLSFLPSARLGTGVFPALYWLASRLGGREDFYDTTYDAKMVDSRSVGPVLVGGRLREEDTVYSLSPGQRRGSQRAD